MNNVLQLLCISIHSFLLFLYIAFVAFVLFHKIIFIEYPGLEGT